MRRHFIPFLNFMILTVQKAFNLFLVNVRYLLSNCLFLIVVCFNVLCCSFRLSYTYIFVIFILVIFYFIAYTSTIIPEIYFYTQLLIIIFILLFFDVCEHHVCINTNKYFDFDFDFALVIVHLKLTWFDQLEPIFGEACLGNNSFYSTDNLQC